MNDMYTPPESDLEVENPEIRYAGFWIRVVASIIDTIWLVAITFTLGWIVYGPDYFASTDFIKGIADFLISYVLPFVIVVVFWIYKSATPGKMILGIKIVDSETHDKVPNSRLILRYVGYYVSTIGLLLGFLWVAWDKRKQGWHDKIARTVVIKN